MEFIITRDDNYAISHHGVKGQKRGERRYQNADGSLTPEGYKHYGVNESGTKEFSRDIKRLGKLKNKADLSYQTQQAHKYGNRAKIGGSVALGLASAAAGSQMAEALKNKYWGNQLRSNQQFYKGLGDDAMNRAGTAYKYQMNDAGKALTDRAIEEHEKARKYGLDAFGYEKKNSFSTNPLSTRTKIIGGAAAVAAGYAGYNAIKASIAKTRISDKGHAKAVERYKKEYGKLVEKYTGTPYADLIKNVKTA